AEDPHTFFPSPGHITTFDVPTGKYIRHETAVTSDYTVTPFYDPMISKLIVTGSNRHETIQRLQITLSQCKVEGIKTNFPILSEKVKHYQCTSRQTTTSFVERHDLPHVTKNEGG